MSEDYKDIFEKVYESIVDDVEKFTGRPMTEGQRLGLHNSGTLMFLENVSMGFYCAKGGDEVEAWLKSLEGFRRE